jgi:phospholipid-binding lipoprotein MlaA
MRGIGAFLVAALVCLLAGCASPMSGAGQDTTANDPFEQLNRQVFALNERTDKAVLLPIAKFYTRAVPEPARAGLHNALQNLNLPVVFANDVFQGEFELAGQTAGRFGVNSTLGFAGLLDPATRMNLPYRSADFGQTLGVYGVGEGPYLVLPFFGPDPPRDLTGQVADALLDPFNYIKLRDLFYYSLGRGALGAIDLRSRNLNTLQDIENSSVDYYASVRSLYRQIRNSEIRHGRQDLKNLPDM